MGSHAQIESVFLFPVLHHHHTNDQTQLGSHQTHRIDQLKASAIKREAVILVYLLWCRLDWLLCEPQNSFTQENKSNFGSVHFWTYLLERSFSDVIQQPSQFDMYNNNHRGQVLMMEEMRCCRWLLHLFCGAGLCYLSSCFVLSQMMQAVIERVFGDVVWGGGEWDLNLCSLHCWSGLIPTWPLWYSPTSAFE